MRGNCGLTVGVIVVKDHEKLLKQDPWEVQTQRKEGLPVGEVC